MTDYARHLVASLAARLLPVRGQRLRARLVRQLLPYCAVSTRRGHLLLNREYKPIGWPVARAGRVDYESFEFDSLAVCPACTPAVAAGAGVTNRVTADGSFWFFYGGESGPAPWVSSGAAADYISRLELFLGGRFTEEGAA